MTVNKQVYEYYNLVKNIIDENKGEMVKGSNGTIKHSYQEVIKLGATITSVTQKINDSCQVLNELSGPVIKQRSHSTVFVGKDSAPLLISLKKFGDTMLSNSCIDSDIDKLSQSIPHIQKNSYQLEDHRKSLTDFRNSMDVVRQGFKKLQSPEDEVPELWGAVLVENTQQPVNLSGASEISSFSDKDIIASSPIKL